MKHSFVLALVAAFAFFSTDVADAARTRARINPGLKKVCKVIRPVGAWMFWKNNKPIRASSAFDAPVIGYNRVPTFAYQKGYTGPLMPIANLYAANGKVVTRMRAYPCRADHCGGRVVGDTTLTATARRRAVQLARSPKGYVQLSTRICAEIPDIGACYNVQRRGPCLGVEGK